MDQSYVVIAGIQVAIVVAMLLVGGFISLKSANLSNAFIWGMARTVVIFLPLALAWFGIFCGMFLQDMNLVIPVLVGVSAVGANFLIDYLVQWRIGA
jgi:hypothetical protein